MTFSVAKLLAFIEKPRGPNSSSSSVDSLASRASTLTRNYGGFCGLSTYRGLEGFAQSGSNKHVRLVTYSRKTDDSTLSHRYLALEKHVSPLNIAFVQLFGL